MPLRRTGWLVLHIGVLLLGSLLLAFGALGVVTDARNFPNSLCYQDNGVVSVDTVVDIDHPKTERTVFPFGGARCQWTLNDGSEYVVTSRSWPSAMVVGGLVLLAGGATATVLGARRRADG